jgi:hypothetical protein
MPVFRKHLSPSAAWPPQELALCIKQLVPDFAISGLKRLYLPPDRTMIMPAIGADHALEDLSSLYFIAVSEARAVSFCAEI